MGGDQLAKQLNSRSGITLFRLRIIFAPRDTFISLHDWLKVFSNQAIEHFWSLDRLEILSSSLHVLFPMRQSYSFSYPSHHVLS
jgi:hypothetical protein